MYQLVIEKHAKKQLEKIDARYLDQIILSIQKLAINPRPYGSKKLKGRSGYRIRVNNYRIIYHIQDSLLIVFVIDIDHRKDVYN